MLHTGQPIRYRTARPLGIGRLTACVSSTAERRGLLVGSSRGLYHLNSFDGLPRRIRKRPIGYIISGPGGVVCYEQDRPHGRIVFLDSALEEIRVDSDLARSINPVAYSNQEVVLFDKARFEVMNPQTLERKPLAGFVAVHTMTPLVKGSGGYEFIASHKASGWPTYFHRLLLPEEGRAEGSVQRLAKLEDPVVSRHLIRLSGCYYLVIPQGQAVFMILKVISGAESGMYPWALVPVPAEARPVGLVSEGNRIYAACSDSLCLFEVAEEFAGGSAEAEAGIL